MRHGARLHRANEDDVFLTYADGRKLRIDLGLFDTLFWENRIRNKAGIGTIGEYELVPNK